MVIIPLAFGRSTLTMILIMGFVVGGLTGYAAESHSDARVSYSDGELTAGGEVISVETGSDDWVATLIVNPAMELAAIIADSISTFVYANLRWVPAPLYEAWMFAVVAAPLGIQINRVRRRSGGEA